MKGGSGLVNPILGDQPEGEARAEDEAGGECRLREDTVAGYEPSEVRKRGRPVVASTEVLPLG